MTDEQNSVTPELLQSAALWSHRLSASQAGAFGCDSDCPGCWLSKAAEALRSAQKNICGIQEEYAKLLDRKDASIDRLAEENRRLQHLIKRVGVAWNPRGGETGHLQGHDMNGDLFDALEALDEEADALSPNPTRTPDMGYLTNGLTFNTLRGANEKRLEYFPGNHAGWALSGWSNATFGECGEAANIIKKIERGDFSLEEARGKLADELADVAIYLDILAQKASIDLGRAVMRKWNSKNVELDIPLYIDAEDWHWKKDT